MVDVEAITLYTQKHQNCLRAVVAGCNMFVGRQVLRVEIDLDNEIIAEVKATTKTVYNAVIKIINKQFSSSYCQCPAGHSGCRKHVFALLWAAANKNKQNSVVHRCRVRGVCRQNKNAVGIKCSC